jgi:hypothetical protein
MDATMYQRGRTRDYGDHVRTGGSQGDLSAEHSYHRSLFEWKF